MARLEQELPKVKDAKYFSTLDIASGLWTIPVHKSDQHKLAFSFANSQNTFTRCRFGYSNSPAEFNIFLEKACPDARERGTLIYVNDILVRKRTLDDHLSELDHVMGQLAAAGVKISLAKGQWCRSKVQFVGLFVGPQGVQPQLGRIQGVATITPPTNVSELQGFLGVCNYLCQFVEHYAEIARPLTNLLKKNVPFEWTDQHQQPIETQHQQVIFLNNQRIRDGVVTNARIASWLLALQSFDIEVSYAQNHCSPLDMGLAACQHCSDDAVTSVPPASPPQTFLNPNHHYFDQSLCVDLPTVYVDGSSFRHGAAPRSGVGVIWLNADQKDSQCYWLGPKTSQFAEVAGILIVLQLAVDRGVRELVICTDSDYTRLSFICHLPSWKTNGFLTSNRKPIKHQDLFMACDALVTTHDMHIYWRKVKGHSGAPGTDNDVNELEESLAKQGAADGTPWVCNPSWLPKDVSSQSDPPHVCVVTPAQPANTSTSKPSEGVVSVKPVFSSTDLVSLQSQDPAISRMILYLSDPTSHLPSSVELDSIPELRALFRVRVTLRMVEGLLMHAYKPPLPVLVAPQSLRGGGHDHASS
uniref:ribonuclease H n=1 Tax=Nothobranchius furzeri TaxID=105023 RepID=A0A8C6LY43_NOTFU